MQQPGLSKAPRRSEAKSSRIVRTGNITNSIVVIGDNNRLSINREGNAIIDRLAANQRPIIKRRSSPIIVGRPTHSIGVLDRELERNTVQNAFQAGNCFEFYSAEGFGKTTLVRYLSSQMQMPDGMVFIDKSTPLDDLLQELFDAFFHSNQIYKPTQVEYKRRFEKIQAFILLDNYNLTREETQVLLGTLPNCIFVLASNERHLWEQGNAIHLPGLPVDVAMSLFQQRIGRQLTQRELSAAQLICGALQGHPLQIIQAAAMVHDDGKSIQDVARQIPGVNSGERIQESALEHLPNGAKSLLALLATFRKAPLPAEHINGILQNAQLAPLLKNLLNRGLVKAHSPKYSLTGSLALYLNRAWNLTQWNETALQHFTNWAEHSPSNEQILDSAEALMATLENAAAANRWKEVLQIGVAIEPSFVIGRRWGFWERLLGMLTRAGQALGERAIEAWVFHQLGSRALCLGNFQEAQALLSRALEIRRAIGDHSGITATQHNLAQLPGGVPPRTPPRSRGGLSSRGWIIPVIGVLAVATLLIIDIFGKGEEHPIPIPPPVQVNTPTKTYTPEKIIFSDTPSLTPSRTRTPSSTMTPSITPSGTPSITSTPTPTKTFTPTPIPPAGDIWLYSGCDRQYDGGIKVQISTQINQDGIVTILFGNEKLQDFIYVTGNSIYNFDWKIPDTYGPNDLILTFYDANKDYWYELGRCSITVWDSTLPLAPTSLWPGSTFPPPESMYYCPMILNWSKSFDISGIQYYNVILENCDSYSSYSTNCTLFKDYTTQSTNQDISNDVMGSSAPEVWIYRWYVFAVDNYGNYSNPSESLYIEIESSICP